MFLRLLIGAGLALSVVQPALAGDAKRDNPGVPMTRPVLPETPPVGASHTSVFWHVQELATSPDGQVKAGATSHRLQLVPIEPTADKGVRLVPPPAGPAPDRVRTKLPTALGE